jgi:hypothetical protein
MLERLYAEAAAHLPSDDLLHELRCAEDCARIATRTRRDAALLRVRCLRVELQRRALAMAVRIENAQGWPVPR